MTYTTIRYFFPHGIEGEAMDCTFKEWKDLDKAIAYCHRYSKGRRFVSVEVEDEKGNVIYELNADGKVADNREQTEKEEMTVKEAIKILEDNNYMITGQFDGWFGTIEGEYEIYDAANDYECIRSRVEEKEIIEMAKELNVDKTEVRAELKQKLSELKTATKEVEDAELEYDKDCMNEGKEKAFDVAYKKYWNLLKGCADLLVIFTGRKIDFKTAFDMMNLKVNEIEKIIA